MTANPIIMFDIIIYYENNVKKKNNYFNCQTGFFYRYTSKVKYYYILPTFEGRNILSSRQF